MVLLCSLLAVACPAEATAQNAPAEPAGPSSAVRANLEWITAVRGLDAADTRLNPDNQTLRLPQLSWIADLRGSIRVEAGSRWQFVIRPHWRGTVAHSWAGTLPRDDRAAGTADMTELYANWLLSDVLSVAYGLQNFQWGPAELVSPSNRIFHEVGIFRDPLYYVRGKHLARVNVSAGRQWSLVGLAELGATDEPAFRAGETFARQGQAKLEFTTSSGASYVGVTAGARQHDAPWFGEYGSFALTEGWSVYFDVSHQRGSLAWYPVASGAGSADFQQSDRDTGRLRTFGVGGLRYTFANGVDARVEYVLQDAGWSDAQMDIAAAAVATTPARESVDRWLRPGLEFAGRQLVLGSVRWPDLPPGGRLDVHGRYLRSLTDGSAIFFATASFEAADALVVFGSVTASTGREFAEFSRLVRATVVGGMVWSW